MGGGIRSQKKPFKSTVEGKEWVKLTTAAVKKRKVSADQLALFDDDGGLEIPDEVHLHVNPETKELYSSSDAPAPVPVAVGADADADEEFDEPNHDGANVRSVNIPQTNKRNPEQED